MVKRKRPMDLHTLLEASILMAKLRNENRDLRQENKRLCEELCKRAEFEMEQLHARVEFEMSADVLPLRPNA